MTLLLLRHPPVGLSSPFCIDMHLFAEEVVIPEYSSGFVKCAWFISVYANDITHKQRQAFIKSNTGQPNILSTTKHCTYEYIRILSHASTLKRHRLLTFISQEDETSWNYPSHPTSAIDIMTQTLTSSDPVYTSTHLALLPTFSQDRCVSESRRVYVFFLCMNSPSNITTPVSTGPVVSGELSAMVLLGCRITGKRREPSPCGHDLQRMYGITLTTPRYTVNSPRPSDTY